MPVEFSLDRLEIIGFRGIAAMTVNLPVNYPTYLIGGNNTGKSTILNALAFALKGGGFHSYTTTEYDFYRGADGLPVDTFTITLHFKAATAQSLPAVQGVGAPVPVHAVRVIGKNKNGRFEHRHVLLDGSLEKITFSPRTALSKEAKEKFQGHENLGWIQSYARFDDIRMYLPDVWLLKPDNIERSLYHWQTGPLNRLAELLTEKFLDEKWKFKYNGEDVTMPDKLMKAHAFFKAAVEEFPFWKEKLKPELESTLSKYLGRPAGMGLRPDVQAFRSWLAQQLAVSFAAEDGSPLTPLQSMGSGWQALVRLACLEALFKLSGPDQKPVFILFEEPETYLHPHLSRKLRDVLNDLAAAGWSVFCSTHAPEFINYSRSQQVFRLWRTSTQTGHGTLQTSTVADGPKFQEKLDERGTHEFLFANRAIFCEGKDDVFALRTYFERHRVDLDGIGISIIDTGGIENLPHYAKMAADLGIPWCALTDEDLDPDGSVRWSGKTGQEVG